MKKDRNDVHERRRSTYQGDVFKTQKRLAAKLMFCYGLLHNEDAFNANSEFPRLVIARLYMTGTSMGRKQWKVRSTVRRGAKVYKLRRTQTRGRTRSSRERIE